MAAISNLCEQTIWLNTGRLSLRGRTNQVICKYVLHGESTQGEVSWSSIEASPGNENVKLKSVQIICNDIVSSEVWIDQEITIKMCYYNYQQDSILLSSIHLKDRNGFFILASADFACANLIKDEWYNRKRPQGFYETICIIPSNFLNYQYYSLDIGILNGDKEWQIWEKDIISFQVNDTGVMKEEYMGNWVGVIRPKLTWKTTYLAH